MAELPSDEMENQQPPGSTPSVLPHSYGETVGMMQLVEMTMQTQAAIGELKADVRNLTARIGDDTKSLQVRLGRVEKFMWIATGAVLVIVFSVGLVGWILRPIVNAVVEKLV